MKHLKTFEKYSEKYYDSSIDFNYVVNLTDEDIIEIYNEYKNDSFIEEHEEEIIDSLKNLRSYIQKYSENDKITLYRVISLSDIDKLDKNNLGEHYVTSPDDIDSSFLYDIGYKDDINRTMYIVEIKVLPKYINFNRTLIMRFNYPHEREISLFNDEHIEIINIEKFEPKY